MRVASGERLPRPAGPARACSLRSAAPGHTPATQTLPAPLPPGCACVLATLWSAPPPAPAGCAHAWPACPTPNKGSARAPALGAGRACASQRRSPHCACPVQGARGSLPGLPPPHPATDTRRPPAPPHQLRGGRGAWLNREGGGN